MGNIFQNGWKWVEEHIGSGFEKADQWMREHNMPDMYVGYNSNNGFEYKVTPNQQPTQPIQTPQNTKPSGYSRVTAATAKDIAQGGMTKDEVQEFNMRHPNETAKIGE